MGSAAAGPSGTVPSIQRRPLTKLRGRVRTDPIDGSGTAAVRRATALSHPTSAERFLKSSYEGPGQKYGEYRAPYQYGHCRAPKTPVAGNPHRLIHIRYMAPVTTGHRSLII
jgi:hypothetical protein